MMYFPKHAHLEHKRSSSVILNYAPFWIEKKEE